MLLLELHDDGVDVCCAKETKQRFDDLQLAATPLCLEALRLLLLIIRRRVLDDIMVTIAYRLPTTMKKSESIIVECILHFQGRAKYGRSRTFRC